MKRTFRPQARVSWAKIGLPISDRREASGSVTTNSRQSDEGLRKISARGLLR